MSKACGCDSCHEEKEPNLKIFLARLLVSAALTLIFSLVEVPIYITIPAFVLAYLLAGFEVIWNAMKNIIKGKVFDENFLMMVATVAAFAIADYAEAAAVMIFFGAGELLQGLAVARSKKNITKLMDIRPDYAHLISGERVSPAEVKTDDIILVKPGERIPLDGIVVSGNSFIDAKALTGESVPQSVKEGDEVLSGTINQDGILEIKVLKEFGESTVSKILELVEHASEKKSKTEKFITRFAKIYTPIIVAVAVMVAVLPPLLSQGSFNEWIYKAISFLVVSCPCALVISIPVGVFGGIGGAARSGILIKGGNYLEALNQMNTVALDKTGTLTEGVFEVTEIKTESITEQELLELAVIAEQHSNHPIAKSIVAHYGGKIKTEAKITEVSGQGMIAKMKDKTICAGNRKLMESIGISELPVFPQTTVYIALNEQYAGCLLIADKLKNETKQGIDDLMAVGITKIIMLTGDNRAIAQDVAEKLDIKEWYAGLLPQDKAAELERMKAKANGKVAFVGDGINDAPVLALADIGIAMGGIGSDAAIESADIILMNDDIGKIATAKRIAGKTRRIIGQNIALALGVKAAAMVLAFLGISSIWMAIFADVGVALLAILNAVRCLRVKNKKSR